MHTLKHRISWYSTSQINRINQELIALCVCSHTHKHTYAHILLLRFLNCHQEWFIYSTIGCSFLWKLLTDSKEFCVCVCVFF